MNTEDKVSTPAPKTNKRVTKVAVKPAPKASSKVVDQPVVEPTPVVVAEEVMVKKVKKESKVKVVRDSFTMPQNEYQKIEDIKAACLKTGRHVKKSEVLRAGLQALSNMSPAALEAALAGLETIRTGRPKKR
jgi:nicotinamide mononucleotide adenylyltransferase